MELEKFEIGLKQRTNTNEALGRLIAFQKSYLLFGSGNIVPHVAC